MKKITSSVNKLLILCILLIIYFGQSFAQVPTKAKWVVDRDFVFSAEGINYPTAHITVSITDANGQTVPDGTPIVINVNKGELKSNSLFSTDTVGSVNYHFKTDINGKIFIDYYPNFLPIDGVTNWQYYQNLYQLKPSIFDENFNALTIDSTSNYPVLVSPDSVKMTVKGRDGDEYVFGYPDALIPETAEITLEVYDQRGMLVPEGTPVGVIAPDEMVDYSGNTLFHQYARSRNFASRNGGSGNYFKTDVNGKIIITFTPLRLNDDAGTVVYFDIGVGTWSQYLLKWSNSGKTQDELWQSFKKLREVLLDFIQIEFNADGSPVEEHISTDVNHYTKLELKHSGTPPVIIGPDKGRITTKGIIHNDQYLFVNPAVVEPAEIQIQLYDDLGRIVPKGTRLSLYNYSSQSSFLIYGANFIQPSDVNLRRTFYLNANGTISLYYQPPNYTDFGTFRLDYGRETDMVTGETLGSVTLTDDSTPPILVGIIRAPSGFNDRHKTELFFSPPILKKGKINDKVNISVLDQVGRLALRGALISISVAPGTLDGASSSIEKKLQKNGKLTVLYQSPTRKKGFNGAAFFRIEGADYFDIYPTLPFWTFLKNQSLPMMDEASNPNNSNNSGWSNFLLGKKFSDVLHELNPIKALSSMKNLADAAKIAREKHKNFILVAGDINSTDAQIQQAKNEYLQAFSSVKNGIGNFISDVPGTSFNPNLPGSATATFESLVKNGIRRHIINTLHEKLIKDQMKNIAIHYIETKIHKKIFPKINIKTNNLSAYKSNNTQSTSSFNFDVQLLSDFEMGESTTGMHEAYGIKFRVSGLGGHSADSALAIGDQDLLPEYFVPNEIGENIAGANPFVAPGLMEITKIDSTNDVIEAVAVGDLFADPDIMPISVVSQTLKDTSNSNLSWLDGTNIQFSSGSVTDSANVFMLGVNPPSPVALDDSLKIYSAYAFGHITQDSIIQNLTLNKLATFSINVQSLASDSISNFNPQPYYYNDSTKKWLLINANNLYTADSISFNVSSTGIYGIGWNPGFFVTDVKVNNISTPDKFSLSQNYPNPFNPTTTISYSIPSVGTGHDPTVQLKVYDILGREVATLVNKKQSAGNYKINFDASRLASGVYFYRIVAGSFLQTKKMILLK